MIPLSPQPQENRAAVEVVRREGAALGLQIGIAGIDPGPAEAAFEAWLAQGWHGEMAYMAHHGSKRSRPAELLPGTCSVISARLDYLPQAVAEARNQLARPDAAYIARYALGRDYHKLLRARLKRLAERLRDHFGPFQARPFCDSAPVLEKPFAALAGLGWVGKHTNLLSRDGSSWFFLGELYTDLPLPADLPQPDHCGDCRACIDACPTAAIVAPGRLDARRCISYLTIELHGDIPEPLRAALGNRIYGCDDCQLVCPWNRFTNPGKEADFLPRHGLDRASLEELFAWDEATFLQRTEGSALRRLGHPRWLRNIAIALGNAPPSTHARRLLQAQRNHPAEEVRNAVDWALQQSGAAA